MGGAGCRAAPGIHPGEILREELLAPLKLSTNKLALELRVPVTRIGEIVNGRRGITPETAIRLARYFGTSEEFWLNLQTRYDLLVAKRKIGQAVAREIRPRASKAV